MNSLSGSVRVYTVHILFTFWLLSVCQKIIKFKGMNNPRGKDNTSRCSVSPMVKNSI